ncbi:AAA domain-containing protein [Halobacteriovorax sp. RZ-3]|uniref:AAA domain-containing protein n=1 Tax=Halobacteriovorax sp. RZ-3 TaxID=3157720 RepID=UPI00371F8E86
MENKNLINRLLEKYKILLCNFTRRNKELFYKESSKAIPLTRLATSVETKNKEEYQEAFEPITMESIKTNDLFEKSKMSLDKHFLLNKYLNPSLEKRIDKTRLADNSYQKEFGLSGAWLLGPFLLWKKKDDTNEDFYVSPLFKIPVDITKAKGKKYDLILESEEISINPTLRIMLKNEFSIDLEEAYAEMNYKEVLDTVMEEFSKCGIEVVTNSEQRDLLRVPPRTVPVKDENGETIGRKNVDLNEFFNEEELKIYNNIKNNNFIIQDIFYVDHIDASKMALYNDYNKIIEEGDHSLITELLLGAKVPTPVDKSKISELNRYTEKENYFVVDIDSSQHLAINSAKSEKAVVIQGPPGTGKSQTITNLIAQLLAENKKVLFVAEKRTALDVVYQRLKKCNLDQQSVVIHSSDLDRSEFYNSFVEVINDPYDNQVSLEWDRVSKDLDEHKNRVEEYFESIKGIDENSGLEIRDLFALYSKYSHIDLDLNIANYFKPLCFEDFEMLRDSIQDLNTLKDKVPNLKINKWLNKQTGFQLTEMNQQILSKCFTKIYKNIDAVLEIDRICIEKFPGAKLEKIQDTTIHLDNETQGFTRLLLKNYKKSYDELELFRTSISNELNNIKKTLSEFLLFRESADYGVMNDLASYYSEPRGFLDFFTTDFWRKRKILKSYLLSKDTKIDLNHQIKSWISCYDNLSQTLGRLEAIGVIGLNDSLKDGNHIDRLDIAFGNSSELAMNINQIGGSRIYDSSYHPDEFDEIYDDYNHVAKLVQKRKELIEELSEEISTIVSYSNFKIELNNENLIETKKLISDTEKDSLYIDSIETFNNVIEDIEKSKNLRSFRNIYLEYMNISLGFYEYSFCQAVKGWYEQLFQSDKSLQRFDSDLHEKNLSRLKDVIDRHRETAFKSVGNNIAKAKEETRSINPRSLSLLGREAQKKRRIKPPREVMESGALDSMISLKRCWLMSPLSISQVLPNVKELFDVVIFDEASQVRIEDSIPCIFRAQNMIVVGDNKQMPPTNFFSSKVDDDYDEDEDLELGESLLDQALKSYPDVLLEWHYRSQAEALIAFSNFAFYGGRLIAPPNPQTLVNNDCLEFVSVENAFFTSKEGNPVEGQMIVNEIVDILKKDPGSSIGIISMGVSQQKTIEKLLDKEAEKDPKFAEALEQAWSYTEDGAFVGFFNKNLENVQGDERDYIIMSVGYAPAKVGGVLRKAFGPLSTKGGGRRLNVAITRAKKKMKIFCSFDPSILETSEEAFREKPDVTCFARYLHFAKAVSDKNLTAANNILDMFPRGGIASQRKPSRFNLDVKNEIEKLGFKVDTEIGTCGFYIDLGVEHPNIENTYMLGIECDGALFHSSDYARDRDKARQSLLEARGWKIHRIWSQNWSRDREGEIRKIKNLLDKLNETQKVS